MNNIAALLSLIALFATDSNAQNGTYWQQKVAYKMDIEVNAKENTFSGKQLLKYTNNSKDTLTSVYYHLYFNAFQPGSMMDVRSRTIKDPDRRVGDRIMNLSEKEIGYQKINSLTQDGKKLNYKVEGTILEVELNKPILPNSTSSFKMEFEAQVPLQVRRSGRDNKEGIRLSMTQWYPKMAEYDYQGWNANPYIGREFHGVWGSFDVTINIDKDYILGATGDLQNPNEVGFGYETKEPNKKVENGKLKWHFTAPLVHDFAWVADPDFKHVTEKLENGTSLHFLYQEDSTTTNWAELPAKAKEIFEEMNSKFGEYPYKQYTVAQGGDGGMEYPMLTLITGKRSKGSLIGVTAHEAIHSWYQHLLATNEAQHPWMDEGFTTYASDEVLTKVLPKHKPHNGSYRSYFSLNKSGLQEPLTTHADHYHTNRAYGAASYSMGSIFLHQLSYIVGKEVLMQGMRRYFNEWKYKHPTPNDFIRVMEKVSNMELSWYLEQWTESTNTIDYSISKVDSEGNTTKVQLERIGRMPMPIDIEVVLKDETIINYTIPLRIMRASKTSDLGNKPKVLKDWAWVYPFYEFTIDANKNDVKSITIDPTNRLADIEKANNSYPKEEDNSVILK